MEEENFISHYEVFENQIADVDSSKLVRTYKLLSTTSDNSINIIVNFIVKILRTGWLMKTSKKFSFMGTTLNIQTYR